MCDNMDSSRECYAKWNKLDTERQMPYYFTYMWTKKQNKWTNKTETDS